MNDEKKALSELFVGTKGEIKAQEDEIKQRQGQVMTDGIMKQAVRKKTVGEEIPDLYETVDMMCSHDFGERIRAEYWQLRIRRMKLERQMDKLIHKVELLDEIDEAQNDITISLMRQQLMTMKEYAGTLIRRATLCGIDLCAGDAEGIAERCIMADKHRKETHNLNGMAVKDW